jgi:tRNA-specific 2-thiouridylase
MENKPVKVAVGLSGGVDSSVAAALLKEKGYDVIGLSMEIYDGSVTIPGSGKHACYGPDEKEDIASAAAVCEKLKIPFHVIDLKKEFGKHVIEYFRNEYLKGRTPNPCIVCNHRLKFGFMLEKAKEIGIDFDKFATGHYARITESDRTFLLRRSLDPSKDQTYFLYALRQEQLSHTMFPLGEYNKNEVKKLARSMGLKTSERPESQDFISGGDYSPFFRSGEIKEGDIVNENGDVLGRHKGVIHYTIGQRRGLGISSPTPVYVSRIEAGKNRVVVSNKDSLLSKGLIAGNVNLISIDRLTAPRRVKVKIRLQHQGAFARLSAVNKDSAEILFEKPQLSVTPGQSAVFYDGDTVVGGGIIEKAIQ